MARETGLPLLRVQHHWAHFAACLADNGVPAQSGPFFGLVWYGTGLGPDGNFSRDGSVKYYLSEDVVEDEQKGVGVCMMAYAEYLRARDAGALAENFPEVEVFNKAYDIILPSDPNFKP